MPKEPTHADTSRQIPQSFAPSDGIKIGTLGVPMALRREPTEKDFADPRFDVLWELMKRVDVDWRNGLFSGATGNDVCAVLDALDAASGWQPIETAPKDGLPFLVFWRASIMEQPTMDIVAGWEEYEELLGYGEPPATHWMRPAAPSSGDPETSGTEQGT